MTGDPVRRVLCFCSNLGQAKSRATNAGARKHWLGQAKQDQGW